MARAVKLTVDLASPGEWITLTCKVAVKNNQPPRKLAKKSALQSFLLEKTRDLH